MYVSSEPARFVGTHAEFGPCASSPFLDVKAPAVRVPYHGSFVPPVDALLR